MGRLLAAEIVQRNVLRALQPAFRVPRRLAMADVIDHGRWHRTVRLFLLGKLESELSRASECIGDVEDHPAFALQT
jgi:hypothetical protein